MKTKVCFINSVAATPFDIRVFHKEAKSLSKSNYDIYLIAQHNCAEIVDGIKIIPIPKPKNRFIRMTKNIFTIFRLALRIKASIYHIHNPELLPLALLLKLVFQKKVIYDVHEDFPKDIFTRKWLLPILQKPIAILFDLFERIASPFFDQIIAATKPIARRFSSKKCVVITNYPLLELTTYNQPIIKTKYFTLIYAGVLSEERGIAKIVQALEYVNDNLYVRLQLIGRFDYSNFENKVRGLKGFSKVEFREWLPYKEVVNYLHNADAGIVVLQPIPNYIESMPNKLFEYMAAGLPVIASNFPLWQEIVEGNNCGILVDPLEPKDIARAIEYLILNPEIRKQMGVNGRKAIIDKYNWEREEMKLLKTYEKMIK